VYAPASPVNIEIIKSGGIMGIRIPENSITILYQDMVKVDNKK
jgi:hypothetical protein